MSLWGGGRRHKAAEARERDSMRNGHLGWCSVRHFDRGQARYGFTRSWVTHDNEGKKTCMKMKKRINMYDNNQQYPGTGIMSMSPHDVDGSSETILLYSVLLN